ncbi:hypothetical protein KP509_31G002100 [Ceratopteris richardii]|uniref:Uncharacterized protein n=1 Tax=Ceratopteris richardii TaxID=49495 RepID=A0A8T2QWL4_CERRI|nr:hypothetical protein KP509_31G002100 [Ceratopteris richardii]
MAGGGLPTLVRGGREERVFSCYERWKGGGTERALAQQFAQLGAKLILSSRRPEQLERVKASLRGPNAPHGVAILPFDIGAGSEAIQEAVLKAEALFDGAGVDFIVHNAAHTRPKFAALDASEEFLKVSSVAGKIPSPAQTVYSASKPAVNGYFHSLRAELADKNIKVIVVCPGPIDTDLKSGTSRAQNLERRLPAYRCAELIIVAATHGLKEAWISYHPILLLLYVAQYLPSVAYAVIDKVGPKRVHSDGQQAYSAILLFRRKKQT